jgi:tetratricopeptide (TPR) repeat protein
MTDAPKRPRSPFDAEPTVVRPSTPSPFRAPQDVDDVDALLGLTGEQGSAFPTDPGGLAPASSEQVFEEFESLDDVELLADDDAETDDGHDFPALIVEPTVVKQPPPNPLRAWKAASDRGATTALRTVRRVRQRSEVHPLVGRTNEALVERAALLESIAANVSEPEKGALFGAASELRLASGDAYGAFSLAKRADDESSDVSRTRLRRIAKLRDDAGAWDDAARSALERGGADAGIVEALLGGAGSTPKERSRSTFVGLWHDAKDAHGSGDSAREVATKLALADAWNDVAMSSALRLEALRAALDTRDRALVESVLTRSRASAPTLEWTALALGAYVLVGNFASAARLALGTATSLPDASLADAFRFVAATLFGRAGDAAAASDAASSLRSLVGLRLVAHLAEASGSYEWAIATLESVSKLVGSSEKAEAWATIAELRAEMDDERGAREAIAAARRSREGHGATRVAAALLRAKWGSDDGLDTTSQGSPRDAAVAAVTALVLTRDARAELDALDRAAKQSADSTIFDTLLTDAAGESGKHELSSEALRRSIDRDVSDLRLGSLLVLADGAMREGHTGIVEALLREALAAEPSRAVAARALGRHLWASSPREAANLWRDAMSSSQEATVTTLVAAWILEAHPDDAALLWRDALRSPTKTSALLRGAESFARRHGDLRLLADAELALGALRTEPREKTIREVRAAYLLAATDAEESSRCLSRTIESATHDPALRELIVRVGPAIPNGVGAALLEAASKLCDGEWALALRLRAALLLESEGDLDGALAVHENTPAEDAFRTHALFRLWRQTGNSSRLLQTLEHEAANNESTTALLRMADIATSDLSDEPRSLEIYQRVLERDATDLESLRALERDAFGRARFEDVYAIEHNLAAATGGARSAAAHARMTVRFARRAGSFDELTQDELVAELSRRLDADTWLARRAGEAALVRGWLEVSARSAETLARAHRGPDRGLFAYVAANAWIAQGDRARALAILEEAVAFDTQHRGAAVLLAELAMEVEDFARACEAWELAATTSSSDEERIESWYRAGALAQDSVGDIVRAQRALEKVAALDIAHADTFGRLREIFRATADGASLRRLIAARIQHGVSSEMLAELGAELGELSVAAGDLAARKEALRALVRVESTGPEMFGELVDLLMEDEEWSEAADVLVKSARVSRHPADLKKVFVALGELYESKIPDKRRAEAAFTRAYKIDPRDLEVTERLAAIYLRDGRSAEAVRALLHACELATDPASLRRHQISLAEAYEASGARKQAEAVLEKVRAATPSDIDVLRRLAELYRQSGDTQALAVHLQRAATEVRSGIVADLADVDAWVALMDVLAWRGRSEASRVVAATAIAIGLQDPSFSDNVDVVVQLAGGRGAALDGDLDELLAPEALSPEARAFFAGAEDVLSALLPFDPKASKAERVDAKDHPWRVQVSEVARWLSVSTIELWVTSASPRVCVPISGRPLGVLVGKDIYDRATEREKTFLLVRAVKLGLAGFAPILRTTSPDLLLVLAGLFRALDPAFAIATLPLAQLDGAAKHASRTLGRKVRPELVAQFRAMAARPGFDANRLVPLALQFGDRVGLVAVGSPQHALNATLRLAGDSGAGVAGRARFEAVCRVRFARTLAEFAISESHFESRRRSGADPR